MPEYKLSQIVAAMRERELSRPSAYVYIQSAFTYPHTFEEAIQQHVPACAIGEGILQLSQMAAECVSGLAPTSSPWDFIAALEKCIPETNTGKLDLLGIKDGPDGGMYSFWGRVEAWLFHTIGDEDGQGRIRAIEKAAAEFGIHVD